jgi:hypothetical protein
MDSIFPYMPLNAPHDPASSLCTFRPGAKPDMVVMIPFDKIPSGFGGHNTDYSGQAGPEKYPV